MITKINRKRSLVILWFIFFASLCLVTDGFADSKKRLKIGVIAPLTWQGAERGESARMGLELARDTINYRRLLKDIELVLVYQDAPLIQSGLAASAAHQLINVEKVIAIVGPMGSSPVGAAAPIIERAGVPAITHTNSAPSSLDGTTYLFRLWPTGSVYASLIASELNERGIKSLGILTTQHDSPLDLLKALEEEIGSKRILYNEEFTPETLDFRSALINMRERNPDAIFLNVFEGQIGVAARQVRELGLTQPLLTNAVMSDIELELARDQLEGVWFPRFAGYRHDGRERFLKKFGKEPPNTESAGAAHDSLLVLAEAIDVVGTDRTEIRDYLRKKEFHGITGSFRFLKNGDATVSVDLYHVREGKIVPLNE